MAGKLRLALIAHDVDAKPLMRLATVYDIPMALHRATEEIVVFAADTPRRTGAIAPAENG